MLHSRESQADIPSGSFRIRTNLAWATNLMKKVTDQKPKWEYIDTYAALLYKTGKLKEAEKQALRAIEIGSKTGQAMDSTRALLARIRNARETSRQRKP
ncbi:MAG: hypothetical protein IH600_17555 [Bacteroidetes bacterium]|nr:hypothetical protein [Bacteroidota bacterium]